TIVSDSEDSTVTYTTVSSPYEGRSRDVSPGVDGPPVMPKDPYAYVVDAFQALPPPDYVPGPEELEQAPPSSVYIPYVPEPVYPEYIPPEDDVFPAEEQPLPAAASPTADSPGYIPESDPDEDPEDDDEDSEEDPADYPADHDDDDEEEEPSGDDADEEDEEQDEDDDDEEEEHPTSFLAMPIPPTSPHTPLSSPLPQMPSPPLPASPLILLIPLPAASPPLQLLSFDRRADRPEVTLLPRKRLSIVHCSGYEAEESSVAASARPMEGRRADYGFVDSVEAEIKQRRAEDIGYGIRDTWIDLRDVDEEEALTTLEGVNTRVTELAAVQEQDTRDIYRVMEDTQGRQTEIFQRVEALVDDSQYHYETGRLVDQEARYVIFSYELKKMAPKKAAPKRTTRMEMVFRISNCLAENQVKFATCTLLAGALTWWNSHVRIVGTDATYMMTWIELKKKMADKYCPRNEMKKIETELWNLEVQGTDVTRSVAASKPKTMQEASEMATGLMDKKIHTYEER
nr:reverse transcriptase domain-containing protein [Tanacetum cinerariifolium]